MDEIRKERVAALVLKRLVVVLFLMAAIAIVPAITSTAETKTPDPAPMTQAERTATAILARQATVRVSSTGCGVSVIGSGFIAEGLVVTNSHIVGDADVVSVDRVGPTGNSLGSNLAITGRSPALDLAVGEVRWGSSLRFGSTVPASGEPVMLAGFGGGRQLSIIEAAVHSYVDGSAYGSEGKVLLLDRVTGVGFSGGPVLNRNGEVVAVLRAFDSVTGLTIAVPTANVVQLAERAANDVEEKVCK